MQCSNVNYESSANGLSLSDCITKKEIYDYNRKKGLTNYIDPFAQLFCVRFNYSPKMDYYWKEKKVLGLQEIQDLRTDPDKSGFVNTFFGQTESTASSDAKKFYRLGEKIYSEVCSAEDPTVCTSQYLDAFPIPQSNIYGMCNNYSSAIFMKSEETECTQIVDLVSDCESTLNPQFYTSRLNVFAGKALSSDKLSVEIASLYKLVSDGDIS